MRLLKREIPRWWTNTSTFSLVEKDAQNTSYAILSHRWGPDEVTFRDIENGNAKAKAGGYRKLEFCAEQAARDGLLYCWIDTCCINKDSSAELSTAINSMFKWYANATKCYVYLPDVRAGPGWEAAFSRSEWFHRGWTLQELLAPPVVEFFSADGIKLGDKKSLEQLIHQASGVSIKVLQGKPLAQIDERERFSWTTERKTTVEEDAVYCLLGIFDVQMPLIYGEGQHKALARLQREIRLQADPRLLTLKDAPWIVPFERNSLFTGRETELAELEGKLFAIDHTSKVAITGLGGVGKTQLVLELLYRTKIKYPACLIMWIAATTVDSIENSYLKVTQHLNIPGHDDQGADIKQLVQDYLGMDDTGQWLLVFDNADDIEMWTTTPPAPNEEQHRDGLRQRPSVISQRLIDYLPKNKGGCIVFTTRNREVAVKLAQTNIVTVREMSEEVATNLLAKSLVDTDHANYPEDGSALLSALTYLPLAIAQAVAYINAKRVSLAEYISLLQEKEEEVISLLSEDFEDYGRYPEVKNPVATTWLISFQQISRSKPLAADYLSFIACINPKDIPQSILPPGPSRKEELDALGSLTAYSFISRRPSNAAFDVHRLVHLTTRNWLRLNNTLDQWTEKTIKHLGEVFPNDDHQNRSIWRLYLPHATYVLASSLAYGDQESRLALIEKCGACLDSDGRWNEAEVMLGEAVTRRTQIFGENAQSTLQTTSNLAIIYSNQGWWKKAEQLQMQMMEAWKTKLGADHPYTLKSINNLSLTYTKQSRWAEAEPLQLQVMETFETKLGADHLLTLTSMTNLAWIYSNQGRWDEAEQLLVPVIETVRTKLEPGQPETLSSMNCLATMYSLQGRWAEAEQLQLQVTKISKTKLGTDHPVTLTSMHNLAHIWKALGRDEEAIKLTEDCFRRRHRILGVGHPYTLGSLANLERWRAGQ